MDRIHRQIAELKGPRLEEEVELNSSGYNLIKDIGSGTFGQVKLATHIDTGLQVAIKVLNKEEIQQNNDFERVAREFEILVRINHPNIIYLYEIIEEDDFYFLVTENCPDGDLETLLKKKQRFEEDEAMGYLSQMISAVDYLHQQNIVHRDIKPENVLLVGKRIKLIDFGLSNTYNPRARLKTPCGSPCFAPPEMVCGMDYDPIKSDVWSLGITLYYMLVGSLPFIDKELKVLYKKIVSGNITFPSFLSSEAQLILSRMLCSNPKNRASLKELLEMDIIASQLCKSSSREESHVRETSILSSEPEPNELALRSVSKQCRVPETLVWSFIKNRNKNAFTAHYYLEVHSLKRRKETLLSEAQQLPPTMQPSNKESEEDKEFEKKAQKIDQLMKNSLMIIKPDSKNESVLKESSKKLLDSFENKKYLLPEEPEEENAPVKQPKTKHALNLMENFDGTIFYSKKAPKEVPSKPDRVKKTRLKHKTDKTKDNSRSPVPTRRSRQTENPAEESLLYRPKQRPVSGARRPSSKSPEGPSTYRPSKVNNPYSLHHMNLVQMLGNRPNSSSGAKVKILKREHSSRFFKLNRTQRSPAKMELSGMCLGGSLFGIRNNSNPRCSPLSKTTDRERGGLSIETKEKSKQRMKNSSNSNYCLDKKTLTGRKKTQPLCLNTSRSPKSSRGSLL